ncbi:hypothetical protein [Terrihabitans sp. B22-R8]|uniref:hypothetical protein n=1 Tax=Terrihabitans sp. B22-R8 TaxID=3425128 RepID=UPI00403CDA2D
MAGTVLVVALGSRLPLPGVDLAALTFKLPDLSSGSVGRISIFALGITPFFTALAYAEILKLAFPSIPRRMAASARYRDGVNLAIRVLALLMAGFQGWAITIALQQSGLVADTAIAFVPVGIACFVSSTAFLIWLADRVELPGVGHGVWLLVCLPLLTSLPAVFSSAIELMQFGALQPFHLLIALAALIVATVLIVLVNRLLAGTEDGRAAPIPITILLWPPFLAGIVAGHVISLPLMFVPDDLSRAAWNVIEMSVPVLSGLLIPVFVYAYFHVLGLDRLPASRRGRALLVATLVACVQIVLAVGAEALEIALNMPLGLHGGLLIVFVTVLTLFRRPVESRKEIAGEHS